MTPVKNEHIIYAYAPLFECDKCLLLVGITDIGWEYLKKEHGNFLNANPPEGRQFANVKEVWIVRGKDKQEVREMLRIVALQKGITITEGH